MGFEREVWDFLATPKGSEVTWDRRGGWPDSPEMLADALAANRL